MDSYRKHSSQSYAPSAPVLPDSYLQDLPPSPPMHHRPESFSSQSPAGYPPPASNYGHSTSSYGHSSVPSYGGYFPPGTHPEIIRSFQMVDRDGSGFIDELELKEALSSNYQKFSLETIRLLMFLFRNPGAQSKIGPNEFTALWNCIGHWRTIFERFDRDWSGKIDSIELRDALYSLGYAVPPSVLQVLISRYDNGSGRRGELNFDSFVECGMIIKGLTEKFKEKDPHYTGSATLTYDTFMTMIIPFILS